MKIFDVDFRTGSLVDRASGSLGTLTTAKIDRTEKGLALNCLPGYSTYSITNTLVGDITINISIKLRSTGNSGYGRLFGNDQFYAYFNVTTAQLYITSNDRSTSFLVVNAIKLNVWHNIIITRTSAGVVTSYVDGVLNLSGSSGTPVAGSITFYVGVGESVANYTDGFISYCSVDNHILTEAERAAAYKSFLHSYPIVHEKYPNVINKPTDLSRYVDTGLAAAYNMIPSGSTLVDISGNLNNCTLNGSFITSRKGLIFNGVNTYTSLSPGIGTSQSFSISFRIKSLNPSPNADVFEGNTQSSPELRCTSSNTYTFYWISSGLYKSFATPSLPTDRFTTLTFTYNSSNITMTLYVNGVYYTSSVFIWDNSLSTLYIGSRGTGGFSRFWKGELEDFRVWNKSLSIQEVKVYHNQFVQPSLVIDFSDEGADSVAKVPSGFVKQSGTFAVKELTTQDTVLKHLEKGVHYMENITAGYISIPSKQAYGEWYFDMYRHSATYGFAFIADKLSIKNGYSLSAAASSAVMSKYIAGTPTDIALPGVTFTADTWYKVKITRTLAGVFNVYIKGGAYGNDWTLFISAVTEATVTTSEYLIIYMDTGDRITNIKLTDGIKQL